MKGFFPLAIEAARQFEAGQLRAPLIILATADEESSRITSYNVCYTKLLRQKHLLIWDKSAPYLF